MPLSPKQTHLMFSEIYAPDNIFLQPLIFLAWFWTETTGRTSILFRYFGLI